MMERRVTVADNLRRTPNGLKLGVLKPGALVITTNLTREGWRQVEQSAYGAGWFQEAYLAAVDAPEEPEQPGDEDDAVERATWTVHYASGRVEVQEFIPV